MSSKTTQQFETIWKYAKFVWKNGRAFRASRQLSNTRINLSLANIELGKMTYRDAIYARRVKEFNQVMVELVQGKWLSACAMEAKTRSEAKQLWAQAFTAIRLATEHSQLLLKTVQSGSQAPLDLPETALSTRGTEIQFAGDAPLVPEINPVVILQGSDYEMGFQYAQQLVEIFGP